MTEKELRNFIADRHREAIELERLRADLEKNYPDDVDRIKTVNNLQHETLQSACVALAELFFMFPPAFVQQLFDVAEKIEVGRKLIGIEATAFREFLAFVTAFSFAVVKHPAEFLTLVKSKRDQLLSKYEQELPAVDVILENLCNDLTDLNSDGKAV